MIAYLRGNLLEDNAQVLVNTVNTVGVMGKGIALQFKQRFPANFVAYTQACKLGQVQTGRMFVTEPGELTGPRWVVNFPTKQHWRNPSRLEWVVDGLQDLRNFLVSNAVSSIALPALGAGLGGLPWAVVRGHIEAALGDLAVALWPIGRFQQESGKVPSKYITAPEQGRLNDNNGHSKLDK